MSALNLEKKALVVCLTQLLETHIEARDSAAELAQMDPYKRRLILSKTLYGAGNYSDVLIGEFNDALLAGDSPSTLDGLALDVMDSLARMGALCVLSGLWIGD